MYISLLSELAAVGVGVIMVVCLDMGGLLGVCLEVGIGLWFEYKVSAVVISTLILIIGVH